VESLQNDDRAGFEEFERGLHKHLMAVEAEVVGHKLRGYDIDEPVVEIDGDRFRRKGRFEKTYRCLCGTTTVERTLYVPLGSHGRAVVPLEMRAGIVEGTWTPLLARVVARSGASTNPKEAAELFEEFGGCNTVCQQPISSTESGVANVGAGTRADRTGTTRTRDGPSRRGVGRSLPGRRADSDEERDGHGGR